MKSRLRLEICRVDGARAIARLLLVTLVLGQSFVTARAADETLIPPVELLADIQLTVHPGWLLTINADGSGSIGYGSNVADFAAVPEGTFDFEKVYSSLAPRVRVTGNRLESFGAVSFHRRHETITPVLYTEDASLVLGLFNTARRNAVGLAAGLSAARIQELWDRYPPSDPVEDQKK